MQAHDPTVAYSPSASPSTHAQHSLSLPPGVFSLSTPSPPPPVVTEGGAPPHSPMLSPLGLVERRDSVAEEDLASLHLQGILWRNAPLSQKVNSTLARQLSNHAHAHPPSPVKSMMSPSGSAGAYYGHPSTPPSGAFSRSIPIAKPRGGAPSLSILSQMQGHSHGAAEELVGGRRGSGSGTATQSSFLGSHSPMGSSLSSSFLAHTPPVRSSNPIDHDAAFSPAQQAEYLLKVQQAYSVDSEGAQFLPMMHSPFHASTRQERSSSFAMPQSPLSRPRLGSFSPSGPPLHWAAKANASPFTPSGRAQQPQTPPQQEEPTEPKLSCTMP